MPFLLVGIVVNFAMGRIERYREASRHWAGVVIGLPPLEGQRGISLLVEHEALLYASTHKPEAKHNYQTECQQTAQTK